VAVDHVPPGLGGSTPSRRTDQRWPRRLPARTPPSQGGEAGSTPVGATLSIRSFAGWRNGRRASFRGSCPSWAWEFESPLGDCGRAGARPSLINSECRVRHPGPRLSIRPGRQTGKAASLRGWCLWVRLPPRLLLRVPSSSGQDTCLTNRIAQVRVLPGRLGSRLRRAAGPTGRHLPCKQEIGVRLPGGPLISVGRQANWKATPLLAGRP
jgi:hypothetical protein